MAVPFSNTKLRVPRGFQNILEGLSREVLRSQPKDIYQFGMVYFDNLMKIREETGNDPTVTGALLEDRFYNNDSFKQQAIDPSDPQQQEAAMRIQTQYRQHAADRHVEQKREEAAAVKIQSQYRGHHDRQHVQEMTAEGGQTGQEEEVDIDLNDPDVANAAVKIQAGFKGYKARKEVQSLKEKGRTSPAGSGTEKYQEDVDLDVDLSDPELNEAATKIQASFRGLQARKEVRDMKESEETKQDSEEHKKEDAAAVKIQAGFRGHQARKQVKEMKVAEEEKLATETQAAVKIQAGIRGHLARKQVHQMKDFNMEETAAAPEEEVDIDLNDPEVQAATLKIQSHFKLKMGKKAPEPEPEKPAEEEIDIDLNDPDVEKAAVKIQAGFKGYKTRKQQMEEDNADSAKKDTDEAEEIDIDLNDPATEAAAVKIQASFRGHKAREEIKQVKDSNQSANAAEEGGSEVSAAAEKPAEEAAEKPAEEESPKAEEEVDIDLTDPEVEQAAIKIQAGFKGFKARKEVQSKKDAEGSKE